MSSDYSLEVAGLSVSQRV